MHMTLKAYADKKNMPHRTVSSMVSTRGLEPVGSIIHRKAQTGLYDSAELDRLFVNYKPRPASQKPRVRQSENDTTYAQNAPFRNIKCPKYYGCYSAAATQNKVMCCSDCEHKDAESQDWLANEMAC